MTLLRSTLVLLTLSLFVALNTHAAEAPFYVIAHMANTPAAGTWAIKQGANGLEMDIHFDQAGQPSHFLHGGKCDCFCATRTDSICRVLARKGKRLTNPCEAESTAMDMWAFLAQQANLQILILDSKVPVELDAEAQTLRGQNLIQTLANTLLNQTNSDNKFKGAIVVSVAALTQEAYIAGAARKLAELNLQDRVLLSFDQEEDRAEAVLEKLQAFGVQRIAYGTGASACYPNQYVAAIRRTAALTNQRPELVYTWTIDRSESMRQYLDAGVQGILTNRPARLRALLSSADWR